MLVATSRAPCEGPLLIKVPGADLNPVPVSGVRPSQYLIPHHSAFSFTTPSLRLLIHYPALRRRLPLSLYNV